MRGEVRTLFISGFPDDTKEREIHNLFRFFTGYEGCILNSKDGKAPVAFVSFVDRNAAIHAIRMVQSMQFDPVSPHTLRVDFAKANSKTKRFGSDPPYAFADPRSTYPYDVYDPYAAPTPAYWYQMGREPAAPPLPQDMSVPQALPPPPYSAPTQTASRMPPCSTLFVGNLPRDITEQDLLRIFRSVSGFMRMRMSSKAGAPIVFVDYSDVQTSSYALQTLQGYPIGDTQLRVEYARTKMGESRRRAREDDTSEDERQAKRPNNGTQNFSGKTVPGEGEVTDQGFNME